MIKKNILSLCIALLVGGTLFAKNDGPTLEGCPTLAMSGTNVSCYADSNGTALVSIAGASGPFIINWSSGQTGVTSLAGLPAGTYTVTVQDIPSGCTGVGAFVVGSPDPISVTETVTDVNCYLVPTGGVNITVLGGTGPYGYNWSNGTTGQDLINVNAGTYTVTITDARGCTYSKTYTIEQPLEALQGIGIESDALCAGDANGSIAVDIWGGTPSYSYLWTSGQLTQDVSGLTATNYSLTVTDFNGCTLTLPFNITEPVVLSGVMSSSSVLCFGDPSGSASVTPSGGTLPLSYSWQNSTTLYSENNPVLNGVIADDYQVTITDANGCQYTDNVVIDQPTILLATTTAVDVLCFGGSDGSVDLTVTGGTLSYSYNWTDGLGVFVSAGQDLANVVADVYTAVVTDGNGCTFTISQEVKQPNLPIAVAATWVDILCFGDNTGSIDLEVSGGTQPFTFSWTSGQTTEDISNILAGTYGYSVVDTNGCPFGGTVVVSQPAMPLTVVSAITDVNCFGESNGVIDLTVTGGTAPYVYDWANSTYLLSNTDQDLINYPADLYRYNVVDDNGCFVIDTLIITQPTKLETSVVGVDILCYAGNNGSVDLTVTGGEIPYAYLWNNGPVTEDIINLYAGYYEVTVTDDNGCIIVDSITLTEPMDSLSFTYEVEDVLCKDGSDGEIDLSITGGTTPYDYNWSSGDTLAEITGLTAGYYTFLITDDNGCLLSDSIFVGEPDAVTLNEVITPVTCFGLSDGIIDITPIGGFAPYSFTWFNSDFALSAQEEDLIDFPSDIYQLEILDSNGCFYEMFLEIVEPDVLAIDYTFNEVSCQGGFDGNILVDIAGGNPAYTTTWSNGALTEDLLNIPSDTYELIVVDTKGCIDSISTDIAQPDSVLIDFEIDQISCVDNYDGAAFAYPNGGNGGYLYNWSNGTVSSDNTGLSNEWYSVVVTDILGCVGMDSVFMTKDSVGCVFPVTAFSPNGDYYNDLWVIDNMELYPEAEIQIFNQWGNLIHNQSGIYEPWDGFINDHPAPSEVYYWIINLNQPDREVLKGIITIVR
jgi:gliding motility-associated-like protein